MGTIVEEAKREWRLLSRDQPGYRFVNQFRRTQRDRSIAPRVARVALGVVLVAIGVVMLFAPGPGWLFVFLGLGMFASESCALARFLDRTEVVMRALAQRLRQWWRRASVPIKAAAVVGVLAAVGLGSAAVWRVWT